MRSTFARLALGAAVTATLVGGTLAAGTGISAAQTNSSFFMLNCYVNPGNPNPFRITYSGVREDVGSGFIYTGSGAFQRWNGSTYVTDTSQARFQINRVGVRGTTGDATCRAFSGPAQNGYIFGAFD